VITVDARGQEISRKPGRARSVAVDLGNGVALETVVIPAGEFLMGTADADRDAIIQEFTRHGTSQADAEEWTDWQRPQHRVHLPEFWMGKFAVTQAQWQQVAQEPKVQLDLNPDPAQFKGADRPVEQVSWEEAVEFCARLAEKTGKPFRLPSEAEWEYACRAGTTTPFHFGETITADLVNCRATVPYGKAAKGQYREQTAPVGSFPPNAFGLYDLHGNVWEWCADPWHDNYRDAPVDGSVWATGGNSTLRVLRGGSWYGRPVFCRAAYRNHNRPDGRDGSVGFRVVCSVFPGFF
jgi:formylglycine-generating enzyme required for sulfatase activity